MKVRLLDCLYMLIHLCKEIYLEKKVSFIDSYLL